jgi:hypothetical protein
VLRKWVVWFAVALIGFVLGIYSAGPFRADPDRIVLRATGTDAVGFVVFQPVDPNGNPTGSLEIGTWVDERNSTTLQVFEGGIQLAVQRNGVWSFPLQVEVD